MNEAEKKHSKVIIELAEFMHDEYERAAKDVGWKTQKSCQVKFKDLPQKNQTVMIRIAIATFEHLRRET